MIHKSSNGIVYSIAGSNHLPTLVLSNSLGADMFIYEQCLSYLLNHFRVLRYNTRGHGGSSVFNSEPSLAILAQDVIDLMDELSIDKALFCGISLGGLTAQYLAINHGERFHAVICSNTAAKIGTEEIWNDRINTVNTHGFEAFVDATLEKWFTEDFILNYLEIVDKIKFNFLACNKDGYNGCCTSIGETDLRQEIKKIKIPCLIIAGNTDPVTTVEQAEYMLTQIPNAKLEIMNAKHVPCAEFPLLYANTIIDFYKSLKQ